VQALLTRAAAALERGRGADAIQLLAPSLRTSIPNREEELALRSALAEAWLLQDDLEQAAAALGRTPDTFRETVSASRLSTLWRLHGRLASARGDQSRAIAMHERALKQAEAAHDSRLIGLAHQELGQCYRHVGDTALAREHITKAASALNAAGDRRHLALVHSLSGISLAWTGRFEDAMAALRQAERLATLAHADDVLARVYGNQANVMLFEHRHDQALALAERSVALYESHGSGHGLAAALATLGQVCVPLGELARAEQALHRALEVRGPTQFHETTGAVFDTLAQIHIVRGQYDAAEECLTRAGDAYGAYGRQTSRWYEWSVRVLHAKLALRRGQHVEAIRLVDDMVADNAPPLDAIQATLIAADALIAERRLDEAQQRLDRAAEELDAQLAPATWGEYLRLRGELHAGQGSAVDAYHDFSQSATLLELLGERYQAALSHLALGRLVARTGARSIAERHVERARAVFTQLEAARDLADADRARELLTQIGTGENLIAPADADDALVRRIVDAAVLPDLLGRETVAALLETTAAEVALITEERAPGDLRVVACVGATEDAALDLAKSVAAGHPPRRAYLSDQLGRHHGRSLVALIASSRPIGYSATRRFRMVLSVARQGFALCAARDHSTQAAAPDPARSLEPLLPGFLAVGASMRALVEQIQRLQGNDLTVLITGESGTGKELVARAIHAGSHRSAATLLPYNCTTTGRDLADSQLFGHRRGAFTGAVSDQQGLIRAASGGTLFLDEIGDLPLDVQPKLLRFLEQSEIMPIGDTSPQRVDVRVLAATNADLEQRVAEGRFREDLYYRLSVIRIHVPPLRERRDEIPHLTMYFLRDAGETLGKPGVRISSEALDVFAQYWWPGNVRQLRNEIHRLVALAGSDDPIEVAHLSPEITATQLPDGLRGRRPRSGETSLAAAVEHVEREVIQASLDRHSGNLSAVARALGLTRRGLYLKLRRLGIGVLPTD